MCVCYVGMSSYTKRHTWLIFTHKCLPLLFTLPVWFTETLALQTCTKLYSETKFRQHRCGKAVSYLKAQMIPRPFLPHYYQIGLKAANSATVRLPKICAGKTALLLWAWIKWRGLVRRETGCHFENRACVGVKLVYCVSHGGKPGANLFLNRPRKM